MLMRLSETIKGVRVDEALTVQVVATEIPGFSSIGYGMGMAPDGSAIRFYDDWTNIRDLQDLLERGQSPQIHVPLGRTILRRRHWAA